MNKSKISRGRTEGTAFHFPGMIPTALRYPPSPEPKPPQHPTPPKQTVELIPPFLGILTVAGRTPFAGNHENFADLIHMGRSMGVTVFVFTPQGLQAKSVRGYLLDHTSQKIHWIPAKLPLPHVVYNRIPSRTAERDPASQTAIQHLLNTEGVHLFNLHYFNKWELYQCLLDSKLRPLVPKTQRWGSLKTLQTMLHQYPGLFLKPVEGKAGIGMMKITRQGKGFELIHQTAQAKKKYVLSHSSALWRLIEELRQQKSYLLQQGIPLAKFRGQPFDVRMLLQKNELGTWELTGAGIRVAGASAISTHVPMGGRIENIHVVFREVFGKRADELYRRVEEVGLQLAHAIEAKQTHPLGELSIDLGVEKTGQMWFFEANSKPMKFDEPEIRTRSLRRLIQYTLHLSQTPQLVGSVDR